MENLIRHNKIRVAKTEAFYRETGPSDAPVILLPHGYPCSSFEFRNFMPRLADRWRLIAPDYPGFGYSETSDLFDYSFNGYADWLEQFVEQLNLDRFVLYLHDFGSPIGARLAIKRPERIIAQIIQNGDIPYEDALGPKYADIEKLWSLPDDQMRAELRRAVTEQNFREEFLNNVRPALAALIPPDLWTLHWSLMTERRKDAAAELLFDLKANRGWFPAHRRYLQRHKPPTLIVWGPQDHYMPEKSARAYLRDLPDAELHLLDGGHWLLETNLDEVVRLVRDFLDRLEPGSDATDVRALSRRSPRSSASGRVCCCHGATFHTENPGRNCYQSKCAPTCGQGVNCRTWTPRSDLFRNPRRLPRGPPRSAYIARIWIGSARENLDRPMCRPQRQSFPVQRQASNKSSSHKPGKNTYAP
jgi:pimeloyl-ACP methyl ester carboxylesterase